MRDKSNKKFWNKFAKLYAPFMKMDKGVYEKICEYICPYLSKDMNVLELACGSGQLSFSLSKYTKSWIGTDFYKQMIVEAIKRGEYENLAYQVGLTSLVLKWEEDERKGLKVNTPSNEFKWNQLGKLYQLFTQTYAHLSIKELKDKLTENINSIYTMIDYLSEEELFKPQQLYGRYIVLFM